MDIDYSKLSDSELEAIAQGNYAGLSDETLQMISGNAPQDNKFSTGEMISNIPSSAAGVASDIATAVTSPIETGTNMYNLAKGLVSKLVPNRQESEKYADAAGQYLMQRYGSLDNTLQSLEKDPVGVVSDLAGVISGGGAMIPKAGKLAKFGAAIDPVNVVANTAMYGLGKVVPENLPKSMYESAAKFSTTLSPKERASLTETALSENLMPTTEGVTKLQGSIGDLSNRIDTLIAKADQSGTTIPRSAIYQNLREVRQNLGGARLGAPQDLQEVSKIVKEFNDYMKDLNKTSLTPSELQRFKTQAYKTIDFDRSADKPSQAKQEVYKGMAKAAKQELEKTIPEIGGLNKRQGALLELLPNLQRSAGRIENRDSLGIGTGIKASGGAALGGDVGAGLGLIQAITDMPKVKAGAALKLNKLQKKGANVYTDNSLISELMRQSLINSGRYNEQLQQQGLLSNE